MGKSVAFAVPVAVFSRLYNRSMWLAASSFDVPEGVLATLANQQLNPKPHQGLSSKKSASHPALDAANSTVPLGLRASLPLNGTRQSERARYYGSALGRFTSPDPIQIMKQKLLDPQQWNMYAYVRNNPLRLLDPTGMYVCDGTKKQCKAFEDSRKRDLKSKDDRVQGAASAYGDPNTKNGITVRFGDPGKGHAGTTTVGLEADPNKPGYFRATADVVIKSGISGTELDATVGHEGVHVENAQAFASSITPDGQYDLSKNLTHWQTEMNAYGVTAAIQANSGQFASWGTCGSGGCVYGPGMSQRSVDATSMILLANPANGYNRFVDAGGQSYVGFGDPTNVLDIRQYPEITK